MMTKKNQRSFSDINTQKTKSIGLGVRPRKSVDEEEFILLLSDLQVGVKSDTYNFKVFERRIRTMTINLLKVASLHRRAHPVKKLNVFLMGDIIHNENIFRFLDLEELEGVVREQIFNYAIPELIRFFQTMLKNFSRVEVWCIHGNHGNLGKPFSQSTNFDDFIYEFLKAHFRNNKRITFHLTRKFYNIANIMGWKFLIIHGDGIRTYLNIPWYGITNKMMRWQNSIGDFDYLCLGHFHHFSAFHWNNKTIFINGTFFSDDEWSIRNLGLAPSVCQMLLGIHAKKGVSFIRKIFLENERR